MEQDDANGNGVAFVMPTAEVLVYQLRALRRDTAAHLTGDDTPDARHVLDRFDRLIARYDGWGIECPLSVAN